jgi:predicted nucleotidyltransferase
MFGAAADSPSMQMAFVAPSPELDVPARMRYRVSVYRRLYEARAEVLDSAVRTFVGVALRRPDVRAVYAFGSVGRRDVGPRSDLDLLVVRETALVGPERGVDLVVEARLAVPCDIVVVTPSEYRDQLQRDRFAVARTGLRSAERDVAVPRPARDVQPALAAFHAIGMRCR